MFIKKLTFLKFEMVFYCHKSPSGNMVKGYSCTIVFDAYMIYRYIREPFYTIML